jgi:dihydrofolate synthase / folylpolyglutamate synthase
VTYREAVQFLTDLQLFGSNFGLERAFKLAELAGSPQQQLRFIHVAGTNGKGSVCAMLESIYRAHGLRVGLYTSPHLVTFRERIQVNRSLISEADVARLASDVQKWLPHFSAERPTFFEAATVMALRYFAEQRCDLVIWETGLGGRLDATNIVTPVASVITNVQFDHEKWLGPTLADIAREKAGIIKPGVPVITAVDDFQALSVLARTAAENRAPLTVVSPETLGFYAHLIGACALHGPHQQVNAAVALATVDALRRHWPVTEEECRTGLGNVSWHGRFQRLQRGRQEIIIDGAHNPDGAAALVGTVRHSFEGEPLTVIAGILEDKNWQAVIDLLASVATELVLVPVNTPRTCQPETLREFVAQRRPELKVRAEPSLETALASVQSAPRVIIAGSLYLIGEALERLEPGAHASERALNDWNARAR